MHRPGTRAFAVRCREDLRHVRKHRRRYELQGDPSRRGMAAPAGRRSAVAWLWMRLGKPVYNLVTRRLLRTRDGEPRRSSSGPWPEWTSPVGPRTGADSGPEVSRG